ncbi:COMM domain-containing protein 6 [Osmerus eperlanus]|uniref:COMM domain-containing protein 6 n=1 Tax=Osmerus eperlanus TaxID=29151 RepID=UPI002E1567B5
MPGLEPSSGVERIVENIAKFPPELFAQTCQRILTHLQGQTRGVDTAEISDRFQNAGIRLDQDALEEVIRFLLLTFRSAGKSNLSGAALVSRLGEGCIRWPPASLQVLQQLWSEQGALVHTQQEAQAMLGIGQLVDMQWKLGMAVSSDTCRSLNSPYVSLLLKLANTSGLITQRSFEMTVPQFQNFYRQFKEMAAVLETV